ncbi:MAG: isoleucine--tRNA ligase [Candidatus Competibacteraceae bacterium]|nr:isoleucine--tRNA ligase [Candidatus Competibacteraceae bacterium]
MVARATFKAVKPQVDIPATEKQVLEFWREQNIFQRSMNERANGPHFVFYEGPPTANGRPGSHHVISRAFKDMFPRYRAMTGCYVLRKGGWDTHGLPVELEVQRQLGFKTKQEVVDYGVAEFNQKCRESVFTYIQEWEELTERIAFWVDMDDAYVTYHNDYIESCWWILKSFWDKELIFQDYKVVPYSPRSGTPYSSHEVSLGYKDVDDPSVYVRFKLNDADNTYFLVWTTTPWTLPGNVALAVGAEVDYVELEGRQSAAAPLEKLILAEALVEAAVTARVQDGGGYQVVRRLKGRELTGLHYEPLYTFLPVEQDYCYVVAGDFVSTEDGTGIVHMAPAFGADDLETGKQYDLPVLMTVNDQGKFIDQVTLVAGQDFKAADKTIIRDLKERGLMYFAGTYRHSYPHCWRDGGPLMYLARSTWYIRASSYRDKMVALNNTINWVPKHTGTGRFGNWLEDLKDWAIGRERFWGTPLPIWRCDNPEIDYSVCVGSRAELEQLSGRELADLDLHRPYVDEITWEVEVDGKKGVMRRVPEVIDVWFDSGAMPFAQWGYPYKNQDRFQGQYPADYICEAVDQTRGWFYSLHAISAMLNESVAFKNVISLGHILDKEGRKMSKSRPETFVGPWDVLDKYGADAFRWYMYTSGAPGEPRRFSVELVGDVVRSFYLTLWNCYSFFTTYAELDGFDPTAPAIELSARDPLDRWILGELHLLVQRITEAYENYDAPNATRPVEQFVDDLSNWYLRRSRRRFWKTESDQDKIAAYQTLYECLVTVAKLLAPAMPFLSEALYRELVAQIDTSAPDSVHLCDWPQANPACIDQTLVDEMRLVKNLVRTGHAARNNAGIRVRQPLAEVSFGVPSTHDAEVALRYRDPIIEELNVKAVKILEAGAEMVEYRLKPVDTLGRELRKDFPAVRKAIVEASPAQAKIWGKALLADESIDLAANGKTFTLSKEQIIVQQSGAEGYAVAESGGILAALKTELSEALIQEGLAREVVRRVQQLRKDADLDIADRIAVSYQASANLSAAIDAFQAYICNETLADEFRAGDPATMPFTASDEFDAETLTVGLSKV